MISSKQVKSLSLNINRNKNNHLRTKQSFLAPNLPNIKFASTLALSPYLLSISLLLIS